MKEDRCVGFGDQAGKCKNEPLPGRYWCRSCDKRRIDHIDSQFKGLAKQFSSGT